MYGIDDNGIVDGLGKPTIKFEFDTNDELKRFLNDNKENLIENYVDVDYTESNESTDTKQGKQKSLKGCLRGLGKPPADIFNVPENQLKTFGFSPTYERLTDYSHLIDTADNTDQLTGYGFDGATLKTLVNVCQQYRHQVAKLADHLKADTPDQSAFNIWHWLHCNVKYNYDTAGKEEIRTPARTWADRKRGVDCDCLSVLTACLLLNMGYNPKFEIVAFSNKPQYSHIFVNLNGMAIDRVLPMFNRRPSLITKTMFMDIPVYQLSGVDDTAIMNGLNGLYSSTLSKIASGTASKKDRLNFRKTQVLVTLQGTDYNAFRLAGLLMPYVSDIDEMGNYYFDNENVADVAVAGENELVAAELRGADEYTLGKLFKKIGKALKKAAKSTVKAVKKVAKSTGKAVKTVAKQTAKVTKAAVKSAANAVKATANVVKAGAQAAAGKGKAAKATLKKAGAQVKKAVVQPVKTVAKATKEIVKKAVVQPVKTAVKVTVINPTKKVVKGTVKAVKTVAKTAAKVVKKTLKIAGKVFKVIFVKLNPATVLMRNSLRLLVALNFVGMATKLNVANMTKDQAIKDGYTAKMWDDAKKAKDRVIKFFTKLGGKKANIEKAIVNGAKKKALFKKDYKPTSKIVETGNDNATLSGTESPIITGIDGLGAAVTIGSALASVGAFIGKIWKWIANIAKTAGKAVAKATVKTGQAVAKATKKTGQAIATATKKTGQAVAKAAKKTGQAIATATKKTGQAVATAAKKTGALVKKVADKMPDGVKQTVKDVANTLKDNAVNKLKDKLQKKSEEKLPQEQLPQSVTKKSNLPLILGISAGVLTIGAIAYSMSKKKSKAA